MPATLTVEDGTIVANANSFVSLAEARAYALNRGVTLSVDDQVLIPQLIKACDWIESKQDEFKGAPVSMSQVLCFPRAGVVLNGFELEEDAIPQQLKNAQILAAMAVVEGVTLLPNVAASDAIKREKVGPVETEYQTGTIAAGMTRLTAAEAQLKPLQTSITLRTFRA